ncbi:hypothetical protein [Tsukamurella spumae]|uniref:Uncharacterized protein n=1 Tax=Tsukamurella spumae TaxID=44753 RepID=A0A846WXU2_9ACTN|nr:hypothetical protein [Tsukamurella spumae]NKY17085.1 hypothetical protein [Tsukamurella spumae]
MDAGIVVIVGLAVAVTFVPIVLMVVVRRRQKRGEWSGGFTPGFRKWTLGDEDEWRNVPPSGYDIGNVDHEPPSDGKR